MMAKPHPYMKPNCSWVCEVCKTPNEGYLEPSRQKKWPPRFCNRTCAGKWRKKENHGRWKGGRIRDGDYWYVRSPSHPHVGNRGYVLEHRLVMEKHLGRYLEPEEVVHHENEDPSDNRIENLRLFPNQSEHKKHHESKRTRDEYGRYLPRD